MCIMVDIQSREYHLVYNTNFDALPFKVNIYEFFFQRHEMVHCPFVV